MNTVQVLQTMEEWILKALKEKASATPEVLEALPKIAEVYLNYSSLVSPDKNS